MRVVSNCPWCHGTAVNWLGRACSCQTPEGRRLLRTVVARMAIALAGYVFSVATAAKRIELATGKSFDGSNVVYTKPKEIEGRRNEVEFRPLSFYSRKSKVETLIPRCFEIGADTENKALA